ncbi:MAG: kelch repeat-containing protein [Gemmatimonadota bacterium]|nr:kelch repeat-containing protein [Gemmatimonadota bacterium]
MIEPRRDHTATRLSDGTVLVAGGIHVVTAGVEAPLTSAEVFDPVAGRFRRTGDLPEGRSGHVAVLLSTGQVLIAGGGRQSLVLYDPDSGSFAGSSAATRIQRPSSATALRDGRVLLLGDLTFMAEIYNPQADSIVKTLNVGTRRVQQTATLLNSGDVLIAGGARGLAQRFDPDTDLFTAPGGASLQVVRFGHTAALLEDGRVLLAGGSAEFGAGVFSPVSSAEIFDPDYPSFRNTGNMLAPRFGHSATRLRDGKVLIVGGAAADAEIYDPDTRVFQFVGGNAGRIRSGATATLLNDGRVLVAGGVDEEFLYLEHALVYNP